MAELSVAFASTVLLTPIVLGAMIFPIIFTAGDRKRDDTGSAVLPVVCNFYHGNLTSADMRILQGMTFDSLRTDALHGIMSGQGSLAHVDFSTPQTRDRGIAHGNISLTLEVKDGGISVGQGSYVLVDGSENSKANKDTIAAFDVISQLLLSDIDNPLAGLTTVLDAIAGREH